MSHKSDIRKLDTEMKAKDKENKDTYLEQNHLKVAKKRIMVVESIKKAGSIIGAGINVFMNDWSKVTASVAGVTMFALGCYTVKKGTGIASRYIEAHVVNPLIVATSRLNFKEVLKYPVKTQCTQMKKFKTKDVSNRLAHHCSMSNAIMSDEYVRMGQENALAMNKELDSHTNSRKGFMWMLAANTPRQLNRVMDDKIDELVKLKLPELNEREQIIRYYFDKCIRIPVNEGKSKFKLEPFDYEKVCSEIAQMTEGLSGGELIKLSSAWQHTANTSDDGVLTKDKVMAEVNIIIECYNKKFIWLSLEDGDYRF